MGVKENHSLPHCSVGYVAYRHDVTCVLASAKEPTFCVRIHVCQASIEDVLAVDPVYLQCSSLPLKSIDRDALRVLLDDRVQHTYLLTYYTAPYIGVPLRALVMAALKVVILLFFLYPRYQSSRGGLKITGIIRK